MSKTEQVIMKNVFIHRPMSQGPVLLVDDPLPDILIDVNSPILLSSLIEEFEACDQAKPLHG